VLPPFNWIIAAEEAHQDGSPHLHMLVQFREKYSSRNCLDLDRICSQHGNYQVARSVRDTVAYVTKKGAYVAEGVDVQDILAKKSPKSSLVAGMAASGSSLKQINDSDPGYFLQNMRKIKDYHQWINRMRNTKELRPWPEVSEADLLNLSETDKQIALWLSVNVRKPRQFRQKQLYVHGPPMTGKSSLVQDLAQFLRVYIAPWNEDYYDGYDDDEYDLIVFDEFTHQKTMQHMNMWLDGSTFVLKVKGSQAVKAKNLPVMVLSNYSLEQNYKKLYEANMLLPLMSRFEIVEVKTFIGPFAFLK